MNESNETAVLIELLRQFLAGELGFVDSGEKFVEQTQTRKHPRLMHGGKYFEVPFVQCAEIEVQADAALIDKGRANYRAMADVERALGVNIEPIEADGFGWLIGGIFTPKGIIIFG